MKTVFKSSEIAHVWAHRQAPHGRSPSNMSFDGDLFKSYNTGIARLCKHKGQEYVLLNTRGFSVTTSAAQSVVRRATSHMKQLFGDFGGYGASLDIDNRGIVEHYANEAREKAKETSKLKASMYNILAASCAQFQNAIDAAVFFGLPWKKLQKEQQRVEARKVEFKEAYDKHEAAVEERRNTADARRDARYKKEREERAKKQLEHIADWRIGKYHGTLYDVPVMLRVEHENDEETQDKSIVTSMGARIPYDAGRRTFQFYMKVHDKGWRRNGETFQIGAYQLDVANPDGLIAGCHRIAHEEIIRFATQEGWITAPETPLVGAVEPVEESEGIPQDKVSETLPTDYWTDGFSAASQP